MQNHRFPAIVLVGYGLTLTLASLLLSSGIGTTISHSWVLLLAAAAYIGCGILLWRSRSLWVKRLCTVAFIPLFFGGLFGIAFGAIGLSALYLPQQDNQPGLPGEKELTISEPQLRQILERNILQYLGKDALPLESESSYRAKLRIPPGHIHDLIARLESELGVQLRVTGASLDSSSELFRAAAQLLPNQGSSQPG